MVTVNGIRAYEVTVRKEKTASSHSGDYAPKLLLPAEGSLPCPVLALDGLRARHGYHVGQVLFPNTTDLHLHAALKQHAEPGQVLTPYSLRIGKATQMADAGLPMEFQRRAGNWATDKTADKYVRNSAGTWGRMQRAMKLAQPRKICSRTAASPIVLTVEPADVRSYPDGKTHILLVRHKLRQWRGYFYEPHSGERTQRKQASKPRRLMDFETFKQEELRYMIQRTESLDYPPLGQLALDAEHVRLQAQQGRQYQARLSLQQMEPETRPAAAGGGGD